MAQYFDGPDYSIAKCYRDNYAYRTEPNRNYWEHGWANKCHLIRSREAAACLGCESCYSPMFDWILLGCLFGALNDRLLVAI